MLAALAFGPAAFALINPDFTPINLVEDSELILTIAFGPVADNRCVSTVGKILKGKTDRKTLTIDLTKAINADQAKRMSQHIAASGKTPGACFAGEGMGEQGERRGFLHVDGTWIHLRGGKDDLWEAVKIDQYMESCWAGGTDMLLRAVDYILADPDADIPCKARASWSQVLKVGHVDGNVASVGPVDLDGNGKSFLFVTSDKGDKLFQHRDGQFKDVSAERKLAGKSLVAAWMDCDADGKIDLVSWDGAALRLYLQGPDGTIVQAAAPLAQSLTDGCLGLSPFDADRNGKPALLVSSRGDPILLATAKPSGPGPAGSTAPWTARTLAEGAPPKAALGKAGPCLVADLDGDSFPDVLQPFKKGSLLYAGKAGGGFAVPAACDIVAGKNNAALCTGDFDADGLLDVLTAGEEGCRIWQNLGKGHFASRGRHSGEIAYIAKGDGIACQACDVNNDGRQDIFLAYRRTGAQIFFNRGFRSTGHAHELDPTDQGLLPPAEKGQQAGCVADFNGDGAQDMVLVLKDGDIYIFLRDVREASPLAVKADLSLKGSFSGPLTVTGWMDKRCLGAWNVFPGTSTGFVGLVEAGQRKITWRLPGGQPQEKTLTVEDAAVRLLIEKP